MQNPEGFEKSEREESLFRLGQSRFPSKYSNGRPISRGSSRVASEWKRNDQREREVGRANEYSHLSDLRMKDQENDISRILKNGGRYTGLNGKSNRYELGSSTYGPNQMIQGGFGSSRKADGPVLNGFNSPSMVGKKKLELLETGYQTRMKQNTIAKNQELRNLYGESGQTMKPNGGLHYMSDSKPRGLLTGSKVAYLGSNKSKVENEGVRNIAGRNHSKRFDSESRSEVSRRNSLRAGTSRRSNYISGQRVNNSESGKGNLLNRLGFLTWALFLGLGIVFILVMARMLIGSSNFSDSYETQFSDYERKNSKYFQNLDENEKRSKKKKSQQASVVETIKGFWGIKENENVSEASSEYYEDSADLKTDYDIKKQKEEDFYTKYYSVESMGNSEGERSMRQLKEIYGINPADDLPKDYLFVDCWGNVIDPEELVSIFKSLRQRATRQARSDKKRRMNEEKHQTQRRGEDANKNNERESENGRQQSSSASPDGSGGDPMSFMDINLGSICEEINRRRRNKGLEELDMNWAEQDRNAQSQTQTEEFEIEVGLDSEKIVEVAKDYEPEIASSQSEDWIKANPGVEASTKTRSDQGTQTDNDSIKDIGNERENEERIKVETQIEIENQIIEDNLKESEKETQSFKNQEYQNENDFVEKNNEDEKSKSKTESDQSLSEKIDDLEEINEIKEEIESQIEIPQKEQNEENLKETQISQENEITITPEEKKTNITIVEEIKENEDQTDSKEKPRSLWQKIKNDTNNFSDNLKLKAERVSSLTQSGFNAIGCGANSLSLYTKNILFGIYKKLLWFFEYLKTQAQKLWSFLKNLWSSAWKKIFGEKLNSEEEIDSEREQNEEKIENKNEDFEKNEDIKSGKLEENQKRIEEEKKSEKHDLEIYSDQIESEKNEEIQENLEKEEKNEIKEEILINQDIERNLEEKETEKNIEKSSKLEITQNQVNEEILTENKDQQIKNEEVQNSQNLREEEVEKSQLKSEKLDKQENEKNPEEIIASWDKPEKLNSEDLLENEENLTNQENIENPEISKDQNKTKGETDIWEEIDLDTKENLEIINELTDEDRKSRLSQNQFEEIKPTLWENIKNKGKQLLNWLTGGLTSAKGKLVVLGTWPKSFLDWLLAKLKSLWDFLCSLADRFKNWLTSGGERIGSVFTINSFWKNKEKAEVDEIIESIIGEIGEENDSQKLEEPKEAEKSSDVPHLEENELLTRAVEEEFRPSEEEYKNSGLQFSVKEDESLEFPTFADLMRNLGQYDPDGKLREWVLDGDDRVKNSQKDTKSQKSRDQVEKFDNPIGEKASPELDQKINNQKQDNDEAAGKSNQQHESSDRDDLEARSPSQVRRTPMIQDWDIPESEDILKILNYSIELHKQNPEELKAYAELARSLGMSSLDPLQEEIKEYLRLHDQLKQLKEQTKALEEQLETANDDLAKAREEKGQSEEEYTELEGGIEALESQRDALKRQRDDLLAAQRKLEEEFERDQGPEAMRMKEDLSVMEKNLAKLEKEIEQETPRLTDAESRLAEINARDLDNERDEVDKLEENHDNQALELTEANLRLEKADKNVLFTEKRLSLLKKQLERLQNYRDIYTLVRKIEAEHKKSEQSLAALQSDTERNTAMMLQFIRKMEELGGEEEGFEIDEEVLDDLRQGHDGGSGGIYWENFVLIRESLEKILETSNAWDLNDYDSKIEKLKKRIKEVEELYRDYTLEQESAKKDHSTLLEAQKALSSKLERLKKRLKTGEERLANLKHEVETGRRELDAKTLERDHLLQQMQRTGTTRDQLLSTLKAKMNNLRSEIYGVSAKIRELNKKIREKKEKRRQVEDRVVGLHDRIREHEDNRESVDKERKTVLSQLRRGLGLARRMKDSIRGKLGGLLVLF